MPVTVLGELYCGLRKKKISRTPMYKAPETWVSLKFLGGAYLDAKGSFDPFAFIFAKGAAAFHFSGEGAGVEPRTFR